ncbi:MAG: DUF4184 family protein [Terriglobales bacterium]|jgi:hypothetical protein
MGHNVEVPFTLAHGAAALPFRRLHLVFSGLLVGTFAPDFEYFLRFNPDDGFGHTLLGTFVLTLPLALLVLWLFHAFVKLPVMKLLPDAIQRRLTNHLGEFGFRGAARFALIVGSILLGIATHLAWDSFTHPNTWPYRHWSILSQPFHVPIAGAIQLYKVFQHGSTIIGIGVLSIWLVFCYRATEPSGHLVSNPASPMRKIRTVGCVLTLAFVGGIVRAVAAAGIPSGHPADKRFVGLLVVTVIALVWWQLVIYGFLASRNSSSAHGTQL